MPGTHEVPGRVVSSGATPSLSASSSSSPTSMSTAVTSAPAAAASAQATFPANSHTGAAGYDYEPERSPGRGVLVRVVVIGLIVSTLLMVAFIWYRWHGIYEPTTAIIIQGDYTLEGTIVRVTGNGRVIETPLQKSNGFVAPILVEPGLYTVVAERDGVVLLNNKEVVVKRFLGIRFPLDEYVREAVDKGLLPPQLPRPEPPPEEHAPRVRPPRGVGAL